jgi:hypothetical protein
VLGSLGRGRGKFLHCEMLGYGQAGGGWEGGGGHGDPRCAAKVWGSGR